MTRKVELLEATYRYVLEHGLTQLSLRPLAAAIGSSPRVLVFLFGSKEGLVRAVLARARTDELAVLDHVRPSGDPAAIGLATAVERLWAWLAAPEHRPVLTLWAESYARSLVEPGGVWGGFAAATVHDWLALLADCQPPQERDSVDGSARRTLALAVLRGALLDLLATGDHERVTAAIDRQLALRPGPAHAGPP
ncbi:TetR/AcrR family transcriptional regulator [Couchioplanes caeruleus]|uniref:TetR/AcrR family transcriptional regulator n=1 Tax=Couchioplanes caeruleus TaxID=56438 RepID=UPI0020BD9FA1|nr:TetR/AcrR family transcriptional regulator [Couchioplanes caeruleus]UQU62159.1 TetR/AcrR family transcriptional regulator [Couchioplanes caeruleus]